MSEDHSEFPPVCPPNIRYRQQNQTNHCMMMYVNYMKCIRLFNEGHAHCNYFLRCVTGLCPTDWVRRWEQQIEDNTFPYDLPDKKE